MPQRRCNSTTPICIIQILFAILIKRTLDSNRNSFGDGNRRRGLVPAKLVSDTRQALVGANGGVLKFPGFLPCGRRSVPLDLPGKSPQKGTGDDAQRAFFKPGIFLGGFGEGEAVQLRINFNGLHGSLNLDLESWIGLPVPMVAQDRIYHEENGGGQGARTV